MGASVEALEARTQRARVIARSLSYNGTEQESQAKAALFELCMDVDMAATCVMWSSELGRLVVVDNLHQSRRMTFKECLAYWLFKAVPRRV